MAIDVQHALADDGAELNTTINTTPLVDVMLVLLVIFLVTIPVIVQEVPVRLPTYRNVVTVTKPENIVIAVDASENVYFDNQLIDISTLRDRLIRKQEQAAATTRIYPEVHIRADRQVRFEAVGRVILACQQAAIQKVGFITLPIAGGD
ncbi:MAG: biopolymer transporter ExbD [Alphaproteobacteria bacterium]|nr:biopolymer transporter ExbD [Alphaproteobacteria bacterium]